MEPFICFEGYVLFDRIAPDIQQQQQQQVEMFQHLSLEKNGIRVILDSLL